MLEHTFNKLSRCLITGCNGKLGREVAKRLFASGRNVVGLSRPGRDVSDLKEIGIPCQTYDVLPQLIRSGDVFVHCAGRTGGGRWEDFLQINVQWTQELFQQAVAGDASAFIYISSIAALGYINRPDQETLVEFSEPVLSTGELYGRSKWQAEQALLKQNSEAGIRLVILRPGLVYGYSGEQHNLLQSHKPIMYPQQRVPLVHTKSFVHCLELVIDNQNAQGIFNVVDDEQPWLLDLMELKWQLGLFRQHPRRIHPWGFVFRYGLKALAKRILGRPVAPRKTLEAILRFQCRRSLYSTMSLREATGWQPCIGLVDALCELTGHDRLAHAWQPKSPLRIGIWQEQGQPILQAQLKAILNSWGNRPFKLIGQAQAAHEVMGLQRKYHFDLWIITGTETGLPQQFDSVVWGCPQIIMLGVNKVCRQDIVSYLKSKPVVCFVDNADKERRV